MVTTHPERAPSSTSGGIGYPGASPPDGAAGRGRLILPQKVVAKIAGQAASEGAAVGGSSGGVLGFGAHPDLDARPRVDVELSGTTAVIELDLVVRYPTSIRQASERARQRVMDRVHQLAGVQVTRVDITVVSLHTGSGPEHRAKHKEGLR